jgi:hypothetical protein
VKGAREEKLVFYYYYQERKKHDNGDFIGRFYDYPAASKVAICPRVVDLSEH